jgi:hypothetical protein
MNHYFCGCARCTVAAVTGPLLLIATGVLFAASNAGLYRFRQTWPVLLILFGLAKALGAVLPGHETRTQ